MKPFKRYIYLSMSVPAAKTGVCDIVFHTHTYTYVHMYVCKWWCTNKGTWQNKMPAEGILSIFDAFRYLNAKGQWHLWQQA